MPWTQRIALALFAFGFAGLGLIIWQPQGHAMINENQPAYFLAISSGAGLKLGESAAELPNKKALSCDKVFSVGPLEIGARCISHGWEVAIER
jgi:hypothetical protein